MARDTKYGNILIVGVPEEEPIFILRAQDVFAIRMLKEYKELRESSGDVDGEKSVQASIDAFKNWNFRKVPD